MTDKINTRETQPDAEHLVNYESLLTTLDKVSSADCVRLGSAGQSSEGREIPYVVIAAPEVLERLDNFKAEAKRAYLEDGELASLNESWHAPTQMAFDKVRLPFLINGGSFGNEAAHVEALLQVIKGLADGSAPGSQEILAKLIVVIVPNMNPDGRELSIAEWANYPLSPALDGAPTANGMMLNRDFMALVEPEAAAILHLFREWHPFAGYDPHEDMFHLGVQRPQVCWTPPYAEPAHPGLDRRAVDMINTLGIAVGEAWERIGFNMLFERQGKHDFMNLFRLGGRAHLTLSLHGTPTLITESARTPGTQTWADRIQQKVIASYAVLGWAAANRNQLLDTVQNIRRDNAQSGAYIIRDAANMPSGVRTLIQILRDHEISVYRVDSPEPAYVVPLSQPEGRLARALLSTEAWNRVALPPALGVMIQDLYSLTDEERNRWMNARLQRVIRLPHINHVVQRTNNPGELLVVPANDVGVRIAKKAADRGAQVWRLHRDTVDGDSKLRAGSFVVDASILSIVERSLAGEATAPIWSSSQAVDSASLQPVRFPRVALYSGQGANERYRPITFDLSRALRSMGFDFAELGAGEIRNGALNAFDCLLIPGGDPDEMVHGWSGKGSWQQAPWELPGKPDGLGDHGLELIRQFVHAGGNYVGVSGGAILAISGYLSLVDATLEAESLGEAQVILRASKRGHPLLYGLGSAGSFAENGDAELFSAYYYSELVTGLRGGPILKLASTESVVATIERVLDEPWTKHITDGSYFAAERKSPAILHTRVGEGNVSLMAVEPAFRGIWRSTFRLLANALLF